MPTPALASLAQRAGISISRAEHLWDVAKEVAARKMSPSHPGYYPYVMGIVKRMMKVRGESLGECLIDISLRYRTQRGSLLEALAQGDRSVRLFFDGGSLCFATPEDVQIEASVDPRMQIIKRVVDDVNWPESHPVYEMVDGYVGSLQDIFQRVLQVAKQEGSYAEAVSPAKPRGRTLAQKEGSRKASRTRMRRSYHENKGFLYHEYYQRTAEDDDEPTSSS